MACEFQVLLNAGEADLGTEAALTALEQVSCLEEQLSVYQPESEVSVLNRRAAHRPYQVSTNLFGLLEQCVELYHETRGAFDIKSCVITMLPVLCFMAVVVVCWQPVTAPVTMSTLTAGWSP